MNLPNHKIIKIKQLKEFVELLGFETRNKYSIETEDGQSIGFAAEQGKGLLGILFRNVLGHWRTFEVHFFNSQRQLEFIASHPFRWIFHRIDVSTSQNILIGSLQQRFGILTKKFDILDAQGNVIAEMRSGFLRLWTFPIKRNGNDYAFITKKWGGLLKEMFLDADTFVLDYQDPSMPESTKKILLAAAIFVDLEYFEDKAGSRSKISLFD